MKKKSELEKQIESLPDKKTGKHIGWTVEQDCLILRFGESKGCEALGKTMNIGGATIRKRLAFLKANTR